MRPARCAPSSGAAAVRATTNAVATTMRAGRSHAGNGIDRSATVGADGIRNSDTTSTSTTTTKYPGTGSTTTSRTTVASKNAAAAASTEVAQPARWAAHAYPRQNAACEAAPAMVPAAAAAAKCGPGLKARKKAIG